MFVLTISGLSTSAWSDIYSAVAAGFVSGTGPRHAGAIETSVRYMQGMAAAISSKGDTVDEAIAAYVRDTLKNGGIVPGYGHAVLRGEDPRLRLVMKFLNEQAGVSLHSEKETVDQKMERLHLIIKSIAVIPAVLKKEVPRMKNPSPNVDSLSGSLLCALGLEDDFAILVMACSRGMGFAAQYVWDRGKCYVMVLWFRTQLILE